MVITFFHENVMGLYDAGALMGDGTQTYCSDTMPKEKGALSNLVWYG